MVAVAAFPTKAPLNVVEVTDVNPAIVVADDPKLIAVLPIVTELFAKLAFVIPAVPDKFEFVNPEIDPPKVIVPVLVIVPPVKVIPETVPAVATEVTPLLTTLVAHDDVAANDADVAVVAFPVKAPLNVPAVKMLVDGLYVSVALSTRIGSLPLIAFTNVG